MQDVVPRVETTAKSSKRRKPATARPDAAERHLQSKQPRSTLEPSELRQAHSEENAYGAHGLPSNRKPQRLQASGRSLTARRVSVCHEPLAPRPSTTPPHRLSSRHSVSAAWLATTSLPCRSNGSATSGHSHGVSAAWRPTTSFPHRSNGSATSRHSHGISRRSSPRLRSHAVQRLR